MNIRETLAAVVSFYSRNRAVGHTTRMLNGIDDDTLIVCQRGPFSHYVDHPKRLVDVWFIPEELAGRTGALAWDNSALGYVFRAAAKALADVDRRAEKAEAVMKEAHAALTRSGVPEQILPIKAPLAHVAYRILWLSARADRLAGLIRDAGEVVAAAGMAAWPCRCLSTAGKGDEHPCVPCKARLVLDAAKEVKP